MARPPLIWMVAVGVGVALGVSACGGSAAKVASPFRVNLLMLEADSGFPAPATAHVTVTRINGKLFERLAGLVPRPLPAPLGGKSHGTTICVPVILTIRLADGHRHVRLHVYRGCQRPASLRPLLRGMCPYLHRPDFCARYRADLVSRRY